MGTGERVARHFPDAPVTVGSVLGLRYARLVVAADGGIDAEALKRHYSYVYVVAYRRLVLAGFTVLEKKTSVVDLTRPLDEVFRRCNATTRNEIARAERLPGLKLATPDGNHDEAFDLYRRVKRRDGVVPETRAEFAQCEVFSAYVDGRMIVAMTCYAEQPVLRLKTIASVRKEPGIDARIVGYASRRLIWEMCRYGKDAGFTMLDLGIVNLTEEAKAGIAQFKRGFGGEIIDTYIYRYETPVFRMVRRLCEVTRTCEIH